MSFLFFLINHTYIKQKNMNKFNQTIKIEVCVDSIAQKMLDNLNVDFPHRELVTENIVGMLLERGGLATLYNNLNGWEDKIDINVGDFYLCPKSELSTYREDDKYAALLDFDIEGVTYRKIKVVKVNRFVQGDNKIDVEYPYYGRDQKVSTSTIWTNHKLFKGLPLGWRNGLWNVPETVATAVAMTE